MPQPANDNRPAEFDAMLTRLYPRVRNYATRYRNHDADDLAQTAMESACRNWRSYRKGASMMPWLVGYVMNAARAKAPLLAEDRAHVALSAPATQEDAVAAKQALSYLSGRGHAAIVTIAKGGTLTEAARAAGMNRNYVGNVISEARHTLQQAANDADARWALRMAA